MFALTRGFLPSGLTKVDLLLSSAVTALAFLNSTRMLPFVPWERTVRDEKNTKKEKDEYHSRCKTLGL
jgi:hypothetical protein